jgi:ankyrin repeat protein
MSGREPCDDNERYLRAHAAFEAGDLAALRAALGDPSRVPNGPMPDDMAPCLLYAIWHSPLAFVRTLIELGANVNPDDHDGFPPINTALLTRQPRAGLPARTDALDLVRLLVASGSDLRQRGMNDYTPLHLAADLGDLAAVALLLELGADPAARTRIDQRETPREIALRRGQAAIAALLAERESAG